MAKVSINRNVAVELMAAFPALEVYADQLKIANRIEIDYEALEPDQLTALAEIWSKNGEATGPVALLSALAETLAFKPEPYGPDDFETLVADLVEYVSTGPGRGWLFRLDQSGVLKPFVASRVDYTPASGDDSARLVLELRANSCGKLAHPHVIFSERDLAGRTFGQIIAAKGYVRETPRLLAGYDDRIETFFEWRNRFGDQFSGRGRGIYAEDPTASHRNTDHARKSVLSLTTGEQDARLVNDEEILTQRDLTLEQGGEILAKMFKRMDRDALLSPTIEKRLLELAEGFGPKQFTEVPVHAYILMFHLEMHHHLWVHMDNMKPYVYQPELKDKLILPREHVDLIDILTAEMDVLMDDIVEGKSGGTTVLCSGPAGVGKTLTAEVYAEIIRRPLYRVHSGQLGLNVSEMEKALKDVLIRAQRWGAVMLIDEADVYIKRRDDDLAMNAVVGVFLRVLEYFNGLLFLTTNRTHDIDEAIVSRCIAMIRYIAPSEHERRQIWDVMATQFGLELAEGLSLTLAQRFPQATGRDIKGLAKLVAKYCSHRDVQPELDVFDHCAIFRGMDLTGQAPVEENPRLDLVRNGL
ncbi:MAG: AAA family ATPase [Magnetovibrionaceae bacterium]